MRISGPGGKTFTLTGDEIRLLTPPLLYDTGNWGVLIDIITAVRAAAQGRPATVTEHAAGVVNDKLSPGGDAFQSGQFAYLCGDVAWPRDPKVYRRDSAADGRKYPLVGAATGYLSPCAFWPVQPREKPTTVNTVRTPVLMVQAVADPGTPYKGARRLRESLGARARMITVDAARHGVYPMAGNTCVNTATNRYLLTGRLPRRDLTCPRNRTAAN